MKDIKAILEIHEKEVKYEFDNLTIDQFIMINEVKSYFISKKYPIGEPITLITSNMPDDLIFEIKNIIKQYCNH